MKRIRTNFNGVQGSPYVSNMYFGDTEAAQDCADKVADFWSLCDNLMVSDCQWVVEPGYVQIDPVTGDITAAGPLSGGTGQGAETGEMLPPSLQVLVQWRTGIYSGGRETRGRTFVPALGGPVTDDGVVDPTFRTSLTAALATWLAAGPPLLIWSRKNGTTAVATSVAIWEQFATLRSRRD